MEAVAGKALKSEAIVRKDAQPASRVNRSAG